MKQLLGLGVLVILVLLTGCHRFAADASRATAFQPKQISAPDVDAAEPVTASAPDGGFYVAWVNHNANSKSDVMLARYDSEGVTSGSPVMVNQQAGVATAWRGDPPSIAVADKSVYVLWTARVESDDKKGTDLYLSVSHDQGKTFASPVRVNDDKLIGAHGMHSLAVSNDGKIYAAWLDERNIITPKPSKHAGGHHMESNRELFVTHSTDGGKTFSANRKVAENACPCCKTALAVSADGTLYAGWRQVLPGNFRHIAVASSTDG
ncbi:MAG TPA: sialidase family protein, partial [Pyrinomonadaceae bacterium]